MIIGDRIRLRPVERADLPRFVKWFGDPEVRDGLMFFAPIGEAQEERWFENNLSRPVAEQVFSIDAKIGAPGAGFVATSAEPNWTHIGSCGFRNIDWRNRSGELGV
ncbi:MAG: GNAT family N-acetyltransferase, partial [Chloroflexi bacterium]|nr:GNAT family N-acetyltransferase [Chloroflexota bacterium]